MEYKLQFDKSIKRWDEAVPLGNGRIGCLIWGEGEELRFSLDRTDIWDRSRALNTELPEFTYKHLVHLAREGNTEEIRRIFDAPYYHPVPTKLPAGKILLRFEEGHNVKSVLDLQTAEAHLTIGEEGGQAALSAICHAVRGSGMLKIQQGPLKLHICLENPGFGRGEGQEVQSYAPDQRQISQGGLRKLHYPEPVWGKGVYGNGVEVSWFVQKVDKGFSYGIIMMVRRLPSETLIFYRIVTSCDGEDWLEEGKRILENQIMEGYESGLSSHRSWWKGFWERSSLTLPDKFFEKQWYLTNYLFASCSRKGCYPMPLQGVWTADDGGLPPWKGDYHNDLNTQLSYTHFYKANHLEEGEAFLDYLWELRDAAGNFAEKFYGTEGICLPGVMTIDGQPLGGWPMYTLSPTQQIWLCQSFELYYRYTGDMDFLREKAWVYLEETAQCITALLETGADGRYYLPISSSPEIHDDEAQAWLTPNSNYDLALMRYLYATLIEFAELLDNGQVKKWKDILKRLPELAVNGKQVLMLSPDESLEESHRHLSNAMAICPLRLLHYNIERERAIIDAVVHDYERLGSGMWVGFSYGWMAHLYAIQGNGEGAREQLRIFWDSFCSPNGFHLNGDFKRRGYTTFHYRPFTLESNMFAADALQEMLFRMEKGVIDLFPAIPADWLTKEISFENLRGENGLLVSAWMKNGDICKIRFIASCEQQVVVRMPAGQEAQMIHLKAEEMVVITSRLNRTRL